MLEVLLALIVFDSPDLRIPPTSFPSSISDAYEIPVPTKTPTLPYFLPVADTLPPDEGNVATGSFLGLISVANAQATSTIDIYASCVRTARIFNSNIPLKDAKDLVPNSEPVINGGILFYYPRTDTFHISIIREFRKDGFWVVEGNFLPGEKSERLVLYSDKFIRGFIK